MSDVGGGSLNQVSVNGEEIKQLINMLEYFESIYAPCASCNLTVNDSSGFNQKANLKGGEDVSIMFAGRNSSSIKMNFVVAMQGNRMRVKNNQDMFNINCVPQEFLEQNQKEIVKAYKGKKVSDMVKDWHDEYIKDTNTIKKDLATNEETEDKQSYHGTGVSPVSAIRWAAKEGKSAEAKASNYLYYQDRDGYHFRTVDKMLQGGDAYTFSYAAQNIGAAGGDPNFKIISFDQQGDFNSLDSSYNGADSDHWYFYDPTTGKVDSSEKGKRDGPGETTHTGSAQLTQKQSSGRGERYNLIVAPGQVKSKFRDSRDPKIAEYKRSLPEHAAQSSAAVQLDNLVINIRVPGNTAYKPGIKVRINIPANQENMELDQRSGSFLVTSIRHIIYKEENDMKYNCILECKSDSKNKSSSGNSGVA
jgi:hypothetical protein